MDKQEIFSINDEQAFEQACLKVFKFQAQNCSIYKKYIEGIKVNVDNITTVNQIPFLPIEFFKSHTITSNNNPAEVVFTSSGTTGVVTSSHYVSDVNWYIESFRKAFTLFYGDISNYVLLALLPSYLERQGSSLIYMVKDLIEQSNHSDSGFFLYNHDDLYNKLKKQQTQNQPTILIGVTFALLDFVEKYTLNFPELIIMETGGMKGRREEMIREELHAILGKGFGVDAIHSEYGMTELLSQGYSKGNGIFNCPPWMKILTREANDPFVLLTTDRAGGINVIDLANYNSCSFIATQDLGKVYTDGSFEILGRFDNSDVRGCNLLVVNN